MIEKTYMYMTPFDKFEDGSYSELDRILNDAVNIGAKGKGTVRHGTTERWDEQPIITINAMMASPNGSLYQVAKKAQEASRYEDPQDAINEMYGCIIYAAGAIKVLEMIRDGKVNLDKIPSKQDNAKS